MSERHVVRCPCCDCEIVVDSKTGQVLRHAEAEKPLAGGATLDSLFDEMDERKARAEKLFEQEKEALDDRGRLLDAKFDEALKKAEEEPADTPPARPWDLD